MDNNDWLERIRDGDDSAIEDIYLNYRRPFLDYFFKKFNLDEHHGLELFQTCVVIFYNNIVTRKLENLTSSPKTYLFSIGKHKAIDLAKAKQKTQILYDDYILESITDGSDPSHKVQLEEDILQISSALDALGDPCKKIIELFYYQKLNMKEISQSMDYKNESTAKNLKYKCLKRLQKIYHER